jgi:hypothetical protein
MYEPMRFGEHSIIYLSELYHSPFLHHVFVSDIYDPVCMSLTAWNYGIVRHLFRLPITAQIRLTESYWFLCSLDEPMRFGEHSIIYLSEPHHSPFLHHFFVSDIYDPLCMSLTDWNYGIVRHLFRLPITTHISLIESHWFLCPLDEPMRFGEHSIIYLSELHHSPFLQHVFVSDIYDLVCMSLTAWNYGIVRHQFPLPITESHWFLCPFDETMRFGEHSIIYLSELCHSPFLHHVFVSDIYDPVCMSLTAWNYGIVRHLFRLPITTHISLTESHWFLCPLDEPMRFGEHSIMYLSKLHHSPFYTTFLSVIYTTPCVCHSLPGIMV